MTCLLLAGLLLLVYLGWVLPAPERRQPTLEVCPHFDDWDYCPVCRH